MRGARICARIGRRYLASIRSAAAEYLEGVKGKKVIFIPISMGFDITESWAAIWRKQAAALGYTFEIRDPNWSTDAGTKALTAAIAEKPDLIDHS